jgi:hypothetical protein
MNKILVIPKSFPLPSEVLLACVRDAITASGIKDGTATLAQPKTRNIGPSVETLTTVMLIIGGGAGAWFTKKWADEYLWPRLKRNIDQPSKDLLDWMFGPDDR